MSIQTQSLSWINSHIKNFEDHLSLVMSHQTVSAYTYDVRRFCDYLEQHKIRRVSSIKPMHLTSYLSECKAQGKSDASINRYYMSIKSFMKYMKKTQIVERDLTEDMKAPRMRQKAPHIPTKEEIMKMMEQPNIETHAGLRDRAILELLYSSGLRASELCDLRINDVGPMSVTISCGKRNKTRTVPVTQKAYEWIQLYICEYRGHEEGPLFMTILGKPVRRQLLCAMVLDYAHKAGLKNVTPHTLRHACATHLMNQGADILLIQKVLGHSSITSTQRYTHLSSCKMQEMFHQFHPRG